MDTSSGLYFSSHEVTQDKRTSLHLTPENPFVFNKKYRITFDALFRNGDGYYGLICRVLGNKEINFDLVSNTAAPTTNFWLVYKDQILFSFSFKEIPESDFGEWINIFIDFDFKKNELTASFNGVEKTQKVTGLSSLKYFDITFGASNNPNFQNTDVAPMSLRNVVITDENDKTNYNWKLAKHATNYVHDEIHGSMATVKNGIWLIDKHVRWVKKSSLNLPDIVGLARNEVDGLIYIISKTKLYVFSVENNILDTVSYVSGCPFNNYYNYFIYNTSTKKIISYDFSENYLNEFDFVSKEWKQSSFSYKEPDYAHHNAVISPTDNELVTFGGYGHYTYKDKFIRYQTDSLIWNTEEVSGSIYPRYLSAAGLDENNNWLIFGGYGSKSGRQEVSPEFFYDLHAYDFNTHQVNKLQDYQSPDIPFVPCETLIKNPETNSFYTLVYNTNNFTTSLKLAEFKINVPEYKIFSDAIPYSFSDIESWCILFLHKASSNFVTATVHKNDVAIYTLAYPPLAASEVIQASKSKVVIWVFPVIGLVLIGFFTFILLRKTKRPKQKLFIKNISPVFQPNIVDLNTIKTNSISTINFLGGFQVFDKDGNDISSVFTPTLKQLFILLLLKTVKNGRGISTTKLNEALWPDKSDNSARNNRNVCISKLRLILNNVGNIDIDQESTYWRINMSGVYSDFVELTSLCERFKEQNLTLEESEIQHFVQLALRGELLPEFQIEWLDEFKADFSNMVLDTLFEFSDLQNNNKNFQQLIDITECILKYDPINEDAIRIKCSTLYYLGKKGLAKTVYENFKKEYENMLGTAFTLSFTNLVENKTK